MKVAGLRSGAAGLLCLCLSFGAAWNAHAALLSPSGILTNTGYPSLADGYVANSSNGTQVAAETEPFVYSSGPTPGLVGSLFTEVIANDTTNPYVAGGGSYGPGVPGALTFIYEVINNGSDINSITNLALHTFDFFGTDVGYDVSGSASTVPFKILRSADGVGDPTSYGVLTVGWTNLHGVIAPNSNSAYLIVNTNATSYTSTYASVQGGAIATVNSYQPLATPEPSTVVLLAAGLGWMAVVALRRRFGKA